MQVKETRRALRIPFGEIDKQSQHLDPSWSSRENVKKCQWDQRGQNEFYSRTKFLDRNDNFQYQTGDIVRIERPSTAVRRHVKKISQEFTITQTKYENAAKTNGILLQIESSDSDKKKNKQHGGLNSIFSPKIEKNTRHFIRKLSSCAKCRPKNRQFMPLISSPPTITSNNYLKSINSTFERETTDSKVSSSSKNQNGTTKPKRSPWNPSMKERENIYQNRSPRRRKSQSAHAGLSAGVLKLPFEQVKKAKLFSEKAVKESKVFSIHGGFPAIRDAMLKRGWVEKVIYTFPYINPHPQNCVCSHVAWHIPGVIHPPPIESSLLQSSNSSSESIVHSSSSILSSSTDSSSQKLAVASLSSINTKSEGTDLTTLNILPITTAQASSEDTICDTLNFPETTQQMPEVFTQVSETVIADDRKSLPNNSLYTSESAKEHNINDSDVVVIEESDEIGYIRLMSRTINPANLCPNEIREGLHKSINRKNLPIFQYSHPPYERKRKMSCLTTSNENKSSKTGDDKELEETVPDINECQNSEDSLEESFDSEAEQSNIVKKPFNPYPKLDYILTDLDKPVIARVLRDIEPNLIWSWNRDSISYKHLSKEQLVNRFPNSPFTTKFGLCETLQQLHWFSEAPGVDTFVPRAYCIGNEDERTAFIHDYRTTACLGLINWIVEGMSSLGPQAVAHPLGEVPFRRIRQALQHVERFIQSCCHDDLDAPPISPLREMEWEALLTAHYRIIHQGRKVKAPQHHIESLLRDCISTLNRAKPYLPQIQMDGNRNIWIVKPGAQSRGRGIFLVNHLDEILALVQSPLIYQTKYVVQKYMERPLLIYNTKFDIRQWFIVTDWNPLTVWMYKESYLRFCSQQYDMANIDESIHLSNNAIQIKYLNGVRDEGLPEENMWDCHQFREYLSSQGHSNAYDEVIYPGMKDALISTMLAAQVQMDSFKHGFEFFGADFMLTEDLRFISLKMCLIKI